MSTITVWFLISIAVHVGGNVEGVTHKVFETQAQCEQLLTEALRSVKPVPEVAHLCVPIRLPVKES